MRSSTQSSVVAAAQTAPPGRNTEAFSRGLPYLKGISTGDFAEALTALLVDGAAGLSAGTLSRLKQMWRVEYDAWHQRDLSAHRYLYGWADGVHFNLRGDDTRACLLVIIGVLPDGSKELVAIDDGVRESTQSWYLFNPVEAKMLCRAVEDCNITWFEEPLHQNDARALAELRCSTRIPLVAGQMEGPRWRLRELVEKQAVDILQPNCTYCGGFTEARNAAHLAQIYNMPIANGWPLFNMHTIAGVMNGWLVEWHLGMVSVGETIFVNPRARRTG